MYQVQYIIAETGLRKDLAEPTVGTTALQLNTSTSISTFPLIANKQPQGPKLSLK